MLVYSSLAPLVLVSVFPLPPSHSQAHMLLPQIPSPFPYYLWQDASEGKKLEMAGMTVCSRAESLICFIWMSHVMRNSMNIGGDLAALPIFQVLLFGAFPVWDDFLGKRKAQCQIP